VLCEHRQPLVPVSKLNFCRGPLQRPASTFRASNGLHDQIQGRLRALCHAALSLTFSLDLATKPVMLPALNPLVSCKATTLKSKVRVRHGPLWRPCEGCSSNHSRPANSRPPLPMEKFIKNFFQKLLTNRNQYYIVSLQKGRRQVHFLMVRHLTPAINGTSCFVQRVLYRLGQRIPPKKREK